MKRIGSSCAAVVCVGLLHAAPVLGQQLNAAQLRKMVQTRSEQTVAPPIAPGETQAISPSGEQQVRQPESAQGRPTPVPRSAPAYAQAQPTQRRVGLPQGAEAGLATIIAGWPQSQGAFSVERFRDGFAMGGERILDPEGRIILYAADSATGNATYMLQGPSGQMTIKLMRFRAGASIPIGTASRTEGQWSIETASGVRVAGGRLTLSPTGFIVARDNALFQYIAGEGLHSYGLPETHTLAAHQNGDISATGWLLLEKRKDTNGAGSARSSGSFLGSLRSLGAAIGLNKADTDYALFQLGTNKTIPIGIALSENQISIMSQCRQKNRWVAICDRADQTESLYTQDGGRPHRAHYFWRVMWFNTPRGPVALIMEDGITKIEAIELATERRATVFERSLGIGDWSASQSQDGRVIVRAELGFERGKNEDVASLFAAPAPSSSP